MNLNHYKYPVLSHSMLRWLICLCFLNVTFSNCKAQSKIDEVFLYGKWEYASIKNLKTDELLARSTIKFFLSDTASYCFAAHLLKSINPKVKYGSWSLDKDKNSLIIKQEDGNILQHEVVKLTRDTLQFIFNKKGLHTLVKINQDTTFKYETIAIEYSTQAATNNQISKLWNLDQIENIEQGQETKNLIKSMLKTTYDIRNNGEIITKSFREKKGKWKLTNENTTLEIILDDYEGGHIWQILEISDHVLKLKKKGGRNTFVYVSE